MKKHMACEAHTACARSWGTIHSGVHIAKTEFRKRNFSHRSMKIIWWTVSTNKPSQGSPKWRSGSLPWFLYWHDGGVSPAAVGWPLAQIEKGEHCYIGNCPGPPSSQRSFVLLPSMSSPFPSPGEKACTFALPTAALWFLVMLLQQLETQAACALAGELKPGSTNETDTSFMDLPWMKPTLFTYYCRHNSGYPLPFFCLALSWISWKRRPVCSIHLRGQRKACVLFPGNPTPLLAVVFFCVE